MLTNQTTPTASPLSGGLLQLCVVQAAVPTVHGTLTALYNSLAQARTVNTLALEQYVADTVPGESPSSWATLGGAGPQGQDWGFQELEAQAVAVRSYVLSDLGGYGGYADTCDLDCQTYRGIAVRDADQHRRGQRHRRPGDGHAGRIGGHDRVLVLDRWLHLERQPTVALHPGARRWRRGSGQSESSLDRPSQLRRHSERVAPDRNLRGRSASTADPGEPYDFPYGRVDTITIQGTASTITIPGAEFFTDLEGDGVLSDLFTIDLRSAAVS